MGAGTECGAPGHARRKPGREAGGWRRGGRAESQQIDSPAASRGGGDSGPGPAVATASRVVAPRDRRAAESRSESRRGGAGRPGRCPRAAGGGDPRPEGRAARPGLRCPFPAAAAAPAGYPRGAVGRWGLLGVSVHGQVGSCEVPGSWRGWVARSQRDATVGLFKWCQASPGLFSLHRPATPAMRRNLRAGKEFSISPASLFYRFFWHAQSHIHSV